jgi:hypothetical protein
MVMFAPTILEFNDKIKIENMPQKIMIFCHKFMERRCLMIVISYTCDRVTLYQFHYMSSILFRKFNLKTCNNVCKVLMKGSHNLSIDVNVTNIVEGPSCFIIINKLFCNFSK